MSLQLIIPTAAFALTSGPSQPETQGFQPIGNSDMVDLFSGDFSYNIPLLDVGGYPVNLAYHSGASLDDESSWVGYGWSLNVGSVNRQMRGIPDDFNGTDQQEREMTMKDHITMGGRISATLELLGFPVGKIKAKAKKKKLNLNGLTFSVGVKKDNYRGIGMEMGVNTGLSLTEYASGENTKSQQDSVTGNFKLPGVGLNLSSFDGASMNINRSILSKQVDKLDKTSISSSIGLGYNSRAGLTHMTLSSSMSTDKQRASRNFGISSSTISFNADSYSPTIDHPTENNSYTVNLKLGPELFIAYVGLGVTGFSSVQSTAQLRRSLPAFGFLHSAKAKNENGALLDFNREKDIPYNKDVKYLPIPIPTYDLFTASSQDGGGQYRAYPGGSGIFSDPSTENGSKDFTLGIDVGAGTYFDVGADINYQSIKTKTQKWKNNNQFLSRGEFPAAGSNALYEPIYFKRVGELVPNDRSYMNKIKDTEPFAVSLTKKLSNAVEGAEASDDIRTASKTEKVANPLIRDKREVRNTTFSYLTAKEASHSALDKTIRDFHPDSLVINNCNIAGIKNNISRTSQYRKSHHISEITVTGDDGKRSVYGLPVYNTYQEEVSFSIDESPASRKKGLVKYTKGVDDTLYNKKGLDNYYSKEVTQPYATSYLLTAILSPDYIDKKGDGITDDDMGTAVKFNYTKLDELYKWRTPFAYGQDSANYNEGLLSDALDDKANYVYGEKEIWYLHSIESKTMVAQFVLGDRNDALGVLNDRGAVNTSMRLKYLKQIRLYSKSDLQKNGNNPAATVPIKVVHFNYSNSICRGLPNAVENSGKLTLDKVYFTFGMNSKGRLHPYQFSYDTSYNHYDYRQYDRWGTFKDEANNPSGLNNSEFPYTLQNSALTNQFASVGQLNKILLPSGGMINVHYESDDYAYVQDKRASQMLLVKGINMNGDSTGLIHANNIYVDLPVPVYSSELKERYFENMDKLYFKFLLDLDGKDHKEFVPGYAQIKEIASAATVNGKVTTVRIQLEKVDGKNPIAKAGWQFLRSSLPKYAYPGSNNLESNESDLKKTVKALVTAFGSIKELIQGFEKRADKKNFSDKFDKGKSWVRLCSPEKQKLGGGSRVRRIDISDDWEAMSGTIGAKTATYSQIFDYTTKDAKGRTISSGVASYEPMLGNDENPFRQPVIYKQKQFLGLDNFHYIEQPFCESYFPAASVGYSRVTVKSIGTGDEESVNRTGVSISEFFTAKDYPTKVTILGLDEKRPVSSKIFKLIGGISFDVVGLSQGYSVELNDMHGKPKGNHIYNKSGQKISSMEYFYKTENELAEKKNLLNDVKVIDADGQISDAPIGIDVETYTDMRQQTTDNLGLSLSISGGSGAILFFPLPFFFPGVGANYDKRSYRASSTIKIVNRFAIQYKTRKIQDGSSITTENLLWDAETGNVLLTKTQNEFDDPVYSFAYPAHWVYNGMGQAYQNLGTVLNDFTSGALGTISNSAYNALLVPGDELVDINSGDKYWVIRTEISGVAANRIIDQNGQVQQVTSISAKLLRSGRRNMANTAVATITTLKNPISGNGLDISVLTKILDAKATVFSEVWSMPVSSQFGSINSQHCNISNSCMEKFIKGSMVYYKEKFFDKSSFYALASDNSITAEGVLDFAYQNPDSSCLANFIGGQPASSFVFYQYNVTGSTENYQIASGDSARLGNCRLYFDSVTPRFNYLANITEDVSTLDSTDTCGKVVRVVNDLEVACGFVVIEEPGRGSPGTPECQTTDTIMRFRLSCPDSTNGCIDPVGGMFNPYYTGILGNWRPKSQMVFQVKRENIIGDPSKFGSTNIRTSGAYSLFNPFWVYESELSSWLQTTNTTRWIAANEVTYFNSKGTEVENKDALNRNSAALFGYIESLPIAVGSNARYRELAYDGFEDYNFSLGCTSSDTCNNGHFNFRNQLGSTASLSDLHAHSGHYSMELNGSVSITKSVLPASVAALFTYDVNGQYILGSNELARGFSPLPGGKYILSFWIKDNAPRDASTSVQASVNGSGLISNLSSWPVVEGWKRVEVPFLLSYLATSFTLQLSSGNQVFIDDIRIHPYDGQMKSFAYDASSQRLMAELDENNFASFYEYDDEGILIRVKKETERGIMTVKETRSAYKKTN